MRSLSLEVLVSRLASSPFVVRRGMKRTDRLYPRIHQSSKILVQLSIPQDYRPSYPRRLDLQTSFRSTHFCLDFCGDFYDDFDVDDSVLCPRHLLVVSSSCDACLHRHPHDVDGENVLVLSLDVETYSPRRPSSAPTALNSDFLFWTIFR